ncbi:LysR family transcriptional regulator [Silvimonas sp.]|uniref:LysR family transcriptional regulator n=1 Tax=Silvimonas sp. TaxID=2650811 RepID=UPI00284763C2|nr:LysR family transcriptional regulator [Silvimonas sp.]MDR3428533.1 LysR family transcriptional regulator [Silvimonas sp.]
MDRLLGMQVFVRVVDLGGFTAASVEFGISPTMVGKHIRELETRLGARLLNRTTRRQSLTEAGRTYYQRCRQALVEVEAADASVDQLRAAPRGELRISAPTSYGACQLAPALTDFLQDFPEISASLHLNDRVIDLVEDGFDVAFRIGTLSDSGLIARPLKPYRMMLCASPAYLARHGTPQTPGDLARHECMDFLRWENEHTWRMFGKDGEMQVQVPARLTINNGIALRNAALAGFGIVLQTEAVLADDLASGRLVQLLPDYAPPARPMHLIYQADRQPTPKLSEFIRFALERFGL